MTMASQWLLLHLFLFLIPTVAAASLSFPTNYRDIQLDIVGLLAVVGVCFCLFSSQVLALTLWPQASPQWQCTCSQRQCR